MCGIVAIVLREAALDAERLEAGVAALDHRGPDGRGVWLSEDRRVGLGHARLSIIDLAGGRQPIASEDGRRQIVVNGEFYDYERLQQRLEQNGHQLATRSDSEVALHLYEDHGVECLRDLRGEFAWALWDDERRELVAARDRFGIKPLYYAERPEGLYLASEAKALFAMRVPASWDHAAFYASCHRPLGDDRTLFAGVRQLPPGHLLRYRDGRTVVERYWDWYDRDANGTSCDASGEAVAATVAEQLGEAVRLRLRADVPVAVYLSGGIDSSVVLGLASRHAATPLAAFTISFSDPQFDEAEHFDETAIARETAEFCGARFHPIPVSSSALAENFAAAVRQSETLHWNPHGVAKFLLSRAVRQAGIKVVLTGEGADELLLGYSWFQLDHLQPITEALTPAGLSRTMKLILGLTMAEEERETQAIETLTASLRRRLGYVPWSMVIEAWFANHLRALMAADFRAAHTSVDSYADLLDGVPRQEVFARVEPPRRSAYLWAKSAFPNYILNVLADRMEMANSIEGRVPFLDHMLVEAVEQAPLATLFAGTTGKQLLRTAFADLLTDTVRRRRKLPFVTPPARSEGGDPFSEMVQDELRGATLESLPFFDPQAVRRYLDDSTLPQTPSKWAYGQSRILTQIASACVLQRTFGLTASGGIE